MLSTTRSWLASRSYLPYTFWLPSLSIPRNRYFPGVEIVEPKTAPSPQETADPKKAMQIESFQGAIAGCGMGALPQHRDHHVIDDCGRKRGLRSTFEPRLLCDCISLFQKLDLIKYRPQKPV